MSDDHNSTDDHLSHTGANSDEKPKTSQSRRAFDVSGASIYDWAWLVLGVGIIYLIFIQPNL